MEAKKDAKKPIKKLQLSKETVRDLRVRSHVKGGPATTNGCGQDTMVCLPSAVCPGSIEGTTC
jgi:hypothetical protein